MREIKFRAWDSSKMHFNFLIAGPQFANLLSIMTDEDFAQKTYNLLQWKVMQFTGLKDRNGVDIYEGDIVKATEMHSDFKTPGKTKRLNIECDYRVIFHEGSFMLRKSLSKPPITLRSSTIRYNGLIVIGNIYSNTELTPSNYNFKS